MPRAGFTGDELGSAIIGSRLVRDVMSLCFLMERRYAPYPKWFGAGFKQLACFEHLSTVLWRAQQAATWPERAPSAFSTPIWRRCWASSAAMALITRKPLSTSARKPSPPITTRIDAISSAAGWRPGTAKSVKSTV